MDRASVGSCEQGPPRQADLGERGSSGCPPLHANVDVAAVEGVQEALDERGPLQGKGRQEEGEADAAEAVALQEGHEETEAHEHHGVHVLEA